MKFVSLFKVIFFAVPIPVLSTSDLKIVTGEETEFAPSHGWPKFDRFGQISAVDVDGAENVYIFHRGNRQWDRTSFSRENVFRDRDKGPIPNDTIVVLDSSQGSPLVMTGANMFYMPHGLTVDSDSNVWVTDVALHQVFKFPPIDVSKRGGGSWGEAILTLGIAFEPGSDRSHFCKPTGVAVDKETKEFYVSDGYCNSRIVKYDGQGKVLLTVGRSSIGSPYADAYMLNVPHALALAQQKQTLFVADRENSRVTSYDFLSGKFKRSYAEELKSKVYSVAYSPLRGGHLFALTNENFRSKTVAVFEAETGQLILSFSPKNNFTNPHDLAVSPDGKHCYVVELSPYKVWKFKIDMDTISRLGQKAVSKDPKTVQTPNEGYDEPVPAESKIDRMGGDLEGSSSSLAIGLIASIVMISFLIFMLHYYSRRSGYRRHESRRLILDDNDGGIRLT